MISCGVDIIEIARIQNAVEKNKSFLGRVFSASEIEYFRQNGCRFECLAGFFAAKEAFVKYKKTGLRGHELSEISVEHESLGAPFVVFRGVRQPVSLSISHDKTHAVAVVAGNIAAGLSRCEEMKRLIPERAEDANKGCCGRVFAVAGSEGMTGAAILAARGALRSGSGLVTVGTVKEERHIVAGAVVEAMTVGLEADNGKICPGAMKKILEFAKKSDAVVLGPGLGQSPDMPEILRGLLSEYEGKLVVDADGLNAMSKDCDMLMGRKCKVVVTPHPGEMSRLVKKSVDEIQKNRVSETVKFAKKYGITVVLKGKDTVVADESGNVKINPTGNCGMATGGTGDVLAGVVAAFMGQGMEPFEAAVLGAYIHGKAGDIAAAEKGVHGLVAGDVAEALPYALKSEIEE